MTWTHPSPCLWQYGDVHIYAHVTRRKRVFHAVVYGGRKLGWCATLEEAQSAVEREYARIQEVKS